MDGRKYRSRKQRPCDLCRFRKTQCKIPDAEATCELCKRTDRQCTFNFGPLRREQRLSGGREQRLDGGTEQVAPDYGPNVVQTEQGWMFEHGAVEGVLPPQMLWQRDELYDHPRAGQDGWVMLEPPGQTYLQANFPTDSPHQHLQEQNIPGSRSPCSAEESPVIVEPCQSCPPRAAPDPPQTQAPQTIGDSVEEHSLDLRPCYSSQAVGLLARLCPGKGRISTVRSGDGKQ